MIWLRHDGDRYWHALESIEPGQSAVMRCNGRWPAEDEVAASDSPPIDERCAACQ